MTGFKRLRLSFSEAFQLVGKAFRTQVFKRLFTILKLLAGVGLLILAVREVQWSNLINGILSASLGWMLLAILAVLLGLVLKLLRWESFVRNYHIKTSQRRLFQAYFVGQSVNILLPFRGGELVRMGYFAGKPEILPEIASTIILEKYLDLLALTVCGLVVSYQISLENILSLHGWLLPISAMLTVLLFGAIILGPALWRKVYGRGILPQNLENSLNRWVETSLWLRNPRLILSGLLLTALIWVVMWSTNIILFNALGISLGGSAAGLVLILVYIGLIPALMPGNLGPFYYFASLALLPFGIIHDQAIIYAVVLHAIVTIPALLAGAISLLIRSSPEVPE